MVYLCLPIKYGDFPWRTVKYPVDPSGMLVGCCLSLHLNGKNMLPKVGRSMSTPIHFGWTPVWFFFVPENQTIASEIPNFSTYVLAGHLLECMKQNLLFLEFNPHITSFIPIWCFVGTSFFPQVRAHPWRRRLADPGHHEAHHGGVDPGHRWLKPKGNHGDKHPMGIFLGVTYSL
jgi:hypothetical protein